MIEVSLKPIFRQTSFVLLFALIDVVLVLSATSTVVAQDKIKGQTRTILIKTGQTNFFKKDVGSEREFLYRITDRTGQMIQLRFRLPLALLARSSTAVPPSNDPQIQNQIAKTRALRVERMLAFEKKTFQTLVEAFRRDIPDDFTFSARFVSKPERGIGNGEYSWQLIPKIRSGPAALIRRLEKEQKELMARFASKMEQFQAQLQIKRASNFQQQDLIEMQRVFARYYRVLLPTDKSGENLVRADFQALVRDFAASLRPLNHAFHRAVEKAGNVDNMSRKNDPSHARNVRFLLDIVLQFYQSIPYRALGERGDVESDILPPPTLLDRNIGDCDTKATALAASLQNLLPDYQTIMLLLPGHALLGIDIPPQVGERHFTWKGRRFVMMEPAGPGLLPIGQLGEETERLLQANQPEILLLTRS